MDPAGTVPLRNNATSGCGPNTDIVWNVGATIRALGCCGTPGDGGDAGGGVGDVLDGVVKNDGADFLVTEPPLQIASTEISYFVPGDRPPRLTSTRLTVILRAAPPGVL